MILRRLKLSNFKNYTDADITLSDNVNCFVGNNGVGKTNLLDAIYYLSFCKSYFNPIDTQNICHGCDFFAIHGEYLFDNTEGVTSVSCILKQGHNKQMRYNKKPYRSLSEHIGRIPLVIVSPNDQELILGGSHERRKFVDGVIAQTDATYLHHLVQYNKALQQRNSLLKTFYDNRYFDEEAIGLWDRQLAHYGAVLYGRRRQFITDFQPLFIANFEQIAGHAVASELPTLGYNSQLSTDDPATDASEELQSELFLRQLQATRQRDAVVQYTTFGVHKDDIELMIDGYPVKKFGSQGQQKTFLLALKLAQFDYMCSRVGLKPLLLLDDIFDKLDMLRIKQLVTLVSSNRFGQVFITDTQQGRIEAVLSETPDRDHRVFIVADNQIIPQQTPSSSPVVDGV